MSGDIRKGKNKEFRAALESRIREKYPDFDPVMALVDIAARQKATKSIDWELIFKARKEVAQYIHPKLRSIELTGDKESPLQVSFTMINPDA